MKEPGHPTEDNHVTVSPNTPLPPPHRPTPALWPFLHFEQITAPFEIGITMREEDIEEYGASLQSIIWRLLGSTEAAGLSASSVSCLQCFAPFSPYKIMTNDFLTCFVAFQKKTHNLKSGVQLYRLRASNVNLRHAGLFSSNSLCFPVLYFLTTLLIRPRLHSYLYH